MKQKQIEEKKKEEEGQKKRAAEEKLKRDIKLQKERALEETRRRQKQKKKAEKEALDKAKAERQKLLQMNNLTKEQKEEKIRVETKKAMEASLGQGTKLTETEFTKRINEAAGTQLADTMSTCVQAAGNDKGKIEKCRTESAKEALANSLGKVEVSQENVEEFLKMGAENAVQDAMSECAKKLAILQA